MAAPFTGTEARHLLRRSRTASLGTRDRGDGTPYVSAANLATDARGFPVIFVSKLAWHTQNLLEDGRGSVMAAELAPKGDALTGARVTVLGRFVPTPAEALRSRYSAHHPAAQMYLDFADFGFWRLEPKVIHAVAGFGRIETLEPGEVFLSAEQAAAAAELGVSAADHVNADHADAVQLYATRLAGAAPSAWKVTAIDADGFFIGDGNNAHRIAFPEPVFSAPDLRRAFARLAETARGQA